MGPHHVPARKGIAASRDGLGRGGHVVLGVRALGLGRIVVLVHVALQTADRTENLAAVAADGKSTFMDCGDVLSGVCQCVVGSCVALAVAYLSVSGEGGLYWQSGKPHSSPLCFGMLCLSAWSLLMFVVSGFFG